MYQKAVELTRTHANATDEHIQAYNLTIKYNLARLYEQIGDGDKATVLYHEILETDPEYHDGKVTLCFR